MCLAIPARISELLDDKQQFAMVDVMGVRRRANIELLRDDPPKSGDWVLIHVGFAMSKISAQYAEEQLQLLSMLGETAELAETAELVETAEAMDQAAGDESAASGLTGEPHNEVR